jgi:phosphoenolpyruvate carboxylase
MSTQHPDNVTLPFFAENSVLRGEDEIQEAYYAFSHLDIGEQMWDAEGKEIDTSVVKKLLSKYEHFFQNQQLGKDIFLTLRVPNPIIDKDEAKVLAETLESIPRSFDVARKFYGEDIAPIFEVILPMTTSAVELNNIHYYYQQCVIGKQHLNIGATTVRQWIGEFKPDKIKVIPLIEDRTSFQNCKQIIGDYISGKEYQYQRVFLARSDPALNYGWLSAVLMNKYALYDIEELQEELSIDLYPIIGAGSSPFRGNFHPENKNFVEGYPSVQTFTVQSAFKYDYPDKKVRDAVDSINATRRSTPQIVDKIKADEIINRYSAEYEKQLRLIVPWVKRMSKYIPKRRKRKLHIGLFGYARGVGDLTLPRAITFCAALYSLGLPPEVLGMSSIKSGDIEFLEKGIYKNVFSDARAALRYVNIDNIRKIEPKLVPHVKNAQELFEVETDDAHKIETSRILHTLHSGDEIAIKEKIVRAGWIRGFLG